MTREEWCDRLEQHLVRQGQRWGLAVVLVSGAAIVALVLFAFGLWR
jgi:hypothetical protein